MSMDPVASIAWPDGKHTKVWRQADCGLVFWTGEETAFPAVVREFERDHDDANRVGINLVDLRLELLEAHEEHMVDTDRDLLAEIDALLEVVRRAELS